MARATWKEGETLGRIDKWAGVLFPIGVPSDNESQSQAKFWH